MNAELLLKHFCRISDAPNAIPRLRDFILDLAVRGKLVDQNPADEPAHELINRLQAQRAQLVGDGLLKQQRSPVIRANERPALEVPRGWLLATLGEVTWKITDGTHKTPAYVSEGVPFVSVKDFSGGRLDFSNTRFISPEEHHLLYKRCDPRRGDILIGRIGTLGKAVVVNTDEPFSLFVSVGLIRFSHDFVSPSFLRLFLNSPIAAAEYDRIKVGGGTHTNKLNLGDLYSVFFPLPPLSEQNRIVAKVDELMVLCTELETRHKDCELQRNRLTVATLHQLSNGETTEAIQAHTRFYINHITRLTADLEQISRLRRTILDLAVRGLLVMQDPADQPASELIQGLKRHDSSEKRGSVLALPQNEIPFVIPPSWAWARFSDVAIIKSNLVDPQEYGDFPHIAPDNIESGTGKLLPYRTIAESGVFSGKHFFSAGCILYSKIRPALAKVVAVDFDGLCSADMYPIQALIAREYLFLYMLSEVFIRQSVSVDNRVAMPKINQAALSKVAIPIPPLNEQYRIATKVDSLRKLCDRLGEVLSNIQAQRSCLLESVLHHVLRDDGPNDGEDNVSRVVKRSLEMPHERAI